MIVAVALFSPSGEKKDDVTDTVAGSAMVGNTPQTTKSDSNVDAVET